MFRRDQNSVTSHVVRGDSVVVTKGREAGKRGKVKRVLKNGRVELEKINIVKRHTKPTQKQPQGGIKEMEAAMSAANVALWCESCGAGRRVRRVFDDSGSKSRACVKCGNAFANAAM